MRLRPAPVVGHSPPSLAKILSGPPVTWVIFIGRANTVAPLEGNLSRLAKFTYAHLPIISEVITTLWELELQVKAFTRKIYMLSHEKRRLLLSSKLIYKIPATNGLPRKTRNIFFDYMGLV